MFQLGALFLGSVLPLGFAAAGGLEPYFLEPVEECQPQLGVPRAYSWSGFRFTLEEGLLLVEKDGALEVTSDGHLSRDKGQAVVAIPNPNSDTDRQGFIVLHSDGRVVWRVFDRVQEMWTENEVIDHIHDAPYLSDFVEVGLAYRPPLRNWGRPPPSPPGFWMFSGNQLRLFDLRAHTQDIGRKIVKQIPLPAKSYDLTDLQFSFSRSGRRILIQHQNRVLVYDMDDPGPVQGVVFPNKPRSVEASRVSTGQRRFRAASLLGASLVVPEHQIEVRDTTSEVVGTILVVPREQRQSLAAVSGKEQNLPRQI